MLALYICSLYFSIIVGHLKPILIDRKSRRDVALVKLYFSFIPLVPMHFKQLKLLLFKNLMFIVTGLILRL